MSAAIEEMVPPNAVGFVLYSFDADDELIDNGDVVFRTRAALVDALRAATTHGRVELGASIPALMELIEASPMPNHFASLTAANGDTVAEVALDERSFAHLLGVVAQELWDLLVQRRRGKP